MDFYSAIQSTAGRENTIVLQSLAHFTPRMTNDIKIKGTDYNIQNGTQSQYRSETSTPICCQGDFQNDLHARAEMLIKSDTGRYDILLQQHSTLKEQHEKLKKNFASLSETVQVLGDQSSQTTRVAQQAQDSKLELISRHSKVESRLQEQLQQAQDLKLDLLNRHTKLQEQLNQAHDSKAELLKLHSSLQEQLQQAHKCKAGLMAQNSVLTEQLKGMKDAVDALNFKCKSTEDQDLKTRTEQLKHHTSLQEQLQEAHKCKTDLMMQNSILREQLKGMKDTVDALTLSCKSTEERFNARVQVLDQQRSDQHSKEVSKLQEQMKGMKDAVETLNLSCKAAEDKLLLQSQLHTDKLRLLEVTHNTLKDRCQTLSASAEQHRVANVLLEERHKSITKDMEILAKGHGNDFLKDREIGNLRTLMSTKEREICHLQSLVNTRDIDISHLQSLVSTKEKNINLLQSQVSTKDTDLQTLRQSLEAEASAHKISAGYAVKIHAKETEISSLRSKIDNTISIHEAEIRRISADSTDKLQKKDLEISSLASKIAMHTNENKLLQGKLTVSQKLLKSHPINPCLNTKTKNVIQSSADILELACDNASVESMRECLGQVGDVLHDLNMQLDTHHRLSNAWLDQVRGF